MSQTTSSLVVPFLDQDDILKQICSTVPLLLQNPTMLHSSTSYETINRLDCLKRNVIKLAQTGLAPDLGPRLFVLYQELDHSTNCSSLLEEEWCPIEDDMRPRNFLIAMTYLKLSALCAFDDARLIWAALAKKVKYERLPYKALEDLDLIKLSIQASDENHITACHEFVRNGMYLICKAYKRSCPTYRFYRLLLKGPRIPWGQTFGSNCDGSVDTDDIVRFLIDKLEGN